MHLLRDENVPGAVLCRLHQGGIRRGGAAAGWLSRYRRWLTARRPRAGARTCQRGTRLRARRPGAQKKREIGRRPAWPARAAAARTGFWRHYFAAGGGGGNGGGL